MTVEEFSNEFDVLVNSYARIKSFDSKEFLDSIEFNEYEKSLFLTKAQEELVISFYSGKNGFGDSFEKTEEIRRYLSNLIKEAKLEPITTTSGSPLGMGSSSKFFTLPEDVLFITYESIEVSGSGTCGNKSVKVVPIRQDEYQSIKDNPFRGVSNRRAFRLDLSEGNVEIISKYSAGKYYLRYIKKLSPIVLEDLPNGLTVEGTGDKAECLLHEALHRKVLDRAVMMALQSKGYTNKSESK